MGISISRRTRSCWFEYYSTGWALCTVHAYGVRVFVPIITVLSVYVEFSLQSIVAFEIERSGGVPNPALVRRVNASINRSSIVSDFHRRPSQLQHFRVLYSVDYATTEHHELVVMRHLLITSCSLSLRIITSRDEMRWNEVKLRAGRLVVSWWHSVEESHRPAIAMEDTYHIELQSTLSVTRRSIKRCGDGDTAALDLFEFHSYHSRVFVILIAAHTYVQYVLYILYICTVRLLYSTVLVHSTVLYCTTVKPA